MPYYAMYTQGWNSFNQSLTAYEMGVYGWVVDAQFVIALGDNFYNDGTESTEDELWETAFHDVYAAPSLNVPWYGVLGNHGESRILIGWVYNVLLASSALLIECVYTCSHASCLFSAA
jgi:hypothetical protein